MNEILNQKFGVEVEMYNITRAKAAVVVKQTLEAWTGETWAIRGPGLHLDERKICKPFGGPEDMVWKIESDSSILARNSYERTELVICARRAQKVTRRTNAACMSMWMAPGTPQSRC
jgi:hypothetical protein